MAVPLRIAMVTTFYPPFNFGGDGQATFMPSIQGEYDFKYFILDANTGVAPQWTTTLAVAGHVINLP